MVRCINDRSVIYRRRSLWGDQQLVKGVSMIRVDFGPISETVFIYIILNTIIER